MKDNFHGSLISETRVRRSTWSSVIPFDRPNINFIHATVARYDNCNCAFQLASELHCTHRRIFWKSKNKIANFTDTLL